MADDNKIFKDLESSIPGIGKKIAEAFISNFSIGDILSKIQEVDIAATKVAKSFGQGRELILGIKQGMTDAVTEVTKLGGGFEDILQIQLDVSKELGRNVVLNSEVYKDLFAAQEVSGQKANDIVKAFKEIGVSTYNASAGVQTIIDTARQLGVNAQEVTSKVVNNMDQLNKFNFDGGVEGLAKMAAQATSLRIDMNRTLGFAEKVFDPEGAISTAAALQRLGVAQSSLLDPLKLMDLAQNDPTELQNQIVQMTQQFVQLNEKGQFEIMPGAKRQLREISTAMGIPYDQLTKMALGSAELDKKFKEITFPDVPEDQKKMIANMAELGKSGQYEVTFTTEKGEKVTKAVSELKKEDIELLGKASQPKTLEDLAKEQLDVNKSIDAGIKSIAGRTGFAIAGGKETESFIEAGKILTKGATEIVSGQKMSTENIRKGFDDTLSTIREALTPKEGKGVDLGKISGLGVKFTESFEKLTTDIQLRTKEVYKNLEASQNGWINLLTKGLESLSKVLPENKGKIEDFAYLPGIGKFEAYPEDTFLGFTDKNRQVENFVQNQLLSPVTTTPTQPFNVVENVPKTEITTTQKEMKVDYSGRLDININAPTGIDINQLQIALNDNSVKQQIISAIQKIQNNELTASVG